MTIGFDVTDFVKVDDLAMTFEVRMKLYMQWNDPQLQLEPFADGQPDRVVPLNTLSNKDHLFTTEIYLYRTL